MNKTRIYLDFKVRVAVHPSMSGPSGVALIRDEIKEALDGGDSDWGWELVSVEPLPSEADNADLGYPADLRPGYYWAKPKPGTERYSRDVYFGLPIGYEVVQVYADVKDSLFIAIPGETGLFNPGEFKYGGRVKPPLRD